MRNISTFCFGLALVLGSNIATAQPAGITMDMINTTLPLEGAPLAVAGPYQVTSEGAFNAAGLLLFRPADLAAFPGDHSGETNNDKNLSEVRRAETA